MLFVLVVNIVTSFVDLVLFGGRYDPISIIVSLVLLLPSLAVSVRRLHDIGRSGWWIFIAVVPILGWLLLLYWYVQPGDEGRNDYDDAMA